MRFLTHLFFPTNTGAPDYDICGQSASILGHVNTTVKFALSDGTTTVPIFDTTDLSSGGTSSFGTYTFGSLDVNFTAINFDPITGSVYLDADFFQVGTLNITTWNKVFLTIYVSKAGYESYTNIIEIYGYDIGNDATLSISGNADFDIYLIEDANNLDGFGRQTKTFSNFTILRQPFTNNVFFYNLVGTQGVIQYLDVNSNVITAGKYGQISVPLNNANSNEVTLQQKIQVLDKNGVLKDTCISSLTDNTKIWLPTVTTTNSTPNVCNDCVNNISTTTVSVVTDYSLVTPYNYNNTLQFPSQYLTQNISYELFDFQHTLIDSQPVNLYTIDYASWFANPATFLIPIIFTIINPPIGDVTVTIISSFSADIGLTVPLIVCNKDIIFTVCNWWTVSKGLICSSYIFNNCSLSSISIVVKKMNDDKTFSDIVTIVAPPASNSIIDLQADGIYLIKVPSRSIIGAFEYYSIANFCKIEACWLSALQKVICNNPTDDCKIDVHYKFNTFLINAHTFFMALNDEFNFSFIYTAIDDERIDNLYTLNSFITRMAEYCDPADDTCIPCSN